MRLVAKTTYSVDLAHPKRSSAEPKMFQILMIKRCSDEPHDPGDEQPKDVRRMRGDRAEPSGMSEDDVRCTEHRRPDGQEDQEVEPVHTNEREKKQKQTISLGGKGNMIYFNSRTS